MMTNAVFNAPPKPAQSMFIRTFVFRQKPRFGFFSGMAMAQ